MNRSLRELVAKVEPIGWSYEGLTPGGHAQLRHTTGAIYTTGSTPSDWRGLKNAVAEMERLGGQRLPRTKHRRGRQRKQVDLEVEASRRRHAKKWEAGREQREQREQLDAERRADEDKRQRMAAVAAAADRRRREIEALMRP